MCVSIFDIIIYIPFINRYTVFIKIKDMREYEYTKNESIVLNIKIKGQYILGCSHSLDKWNEAVPKIIFVSLLK